MSDEVSKRPSTSDSSIAPVLNYIGNKARVNFDGGCSKQEKIIFTHEKIVNAYIAYETSLWNCVDSSDSTLGNSLFVAVTLVKTADIDKYKYWI